MCSHVLIIRCSLLPKFGNAVIFINNQNLSTMTEKEMIAAWEKQQKRIKESLNPRKNTLETWTPHNYSVEPLSEEESLHFAQMINPDMYMRK